MNQVYITMLKTFLTGLSNRDYAKYRKEAEKILDQEDKRRGL